MSETERTEGALGQAREELGALAREVEAFESETLSPMVEFFGQAMSEISGVMSREIEDAARTGRFAIRDMVSDMLQELSKLGAERFVRAPLEDALHGLLGGVFGGARASGGRVVPGASYLVGERGPEIFTPRMAGEVQPREAQVTVNLTMPAGSAEPVFQRSQAQIAGLLARTVGRAVRHG